METFLWIVLGLIAYLAFAYMIGGMLSSNDEKWQATMKEYYAREKSENKLRILRGDKQ